MYKLKRMLILSSILLLSFFQLLSNIKNKPYFYDLKNYKIKSPYTTIISNNTNQNWCILQTLNGTIYSANQGGILIYDGVEWRKQDIPNKAVRSLATYYNNKIIIGGRNEFGFLDKNHSYVSLSNRLEDKYKNFSNVWQIVTNSKAAYLRTSKYIFVYTNNEVSTISLNKTFQYIFIHNDKAFVQIKGEGIFKISESNILKFISNSNIFNKDKIFAKLDRQDHSILLSRKTGAIFKKGSIEKYTSPNNDFFTKSQLYSATSSKTNDYFATLKSGIMICGDNKNEIHLDLESGLYDNDAKHIYLDEANNIWVALNSGISRANFNTPSAHILDSTTLGKINSIIRHNSNIIIGSSNGVYCYNPVSKDINKYHLKSNSPISNAWSSTVNNDNLLIATDKGILNYKNNKVQQLPRSYCIKSTKHNNTLWIGTVNGIYHVRDSKTTKLQNIKRPIRSIVEEHTDTLWLGTHSSTVYKLKLVSKDGKIDLNSCESKRFNSAHGLPKGSIFVTRAAKHTIFATSKGIYRFDEQSERFVPDETLGKEFCNGSRNVFRLVEDKKSNIWFYSKGDFFKAEPLGNGKYRVISKPFKAFPRVQTNVIYPDGDIIWFGTNEGLIRYDTTVKKDYNRPFNTLVTRMASGEEELFLGYTMDNEKAVTLPWEKRNLWFTYASPYFEHEEKTTYQYRLMGSDTDEWSPWERKTKKEFSNLEPGSYIFEARGRNVYETVGKTAKFRFRILPPWYRTWWAWSIWFLLFAGFVYLLMMLRSLKLVKEKEALEEVVKDRTKEISEKNLLLENQADQLMEMDRIKSSFFANISHEFRTPLTLITGPMEDLLKSKRSPREQETMQMILRNSRQLLSLINQLLDLSKLENSTLGLSPSVENISKFIRDITNTFKATAEISNKKLIFNSSDEHLRIAFDREKLRQIVVNLLSNAIKFTESGDTVSISINRVHGDLVTIEVEDTGAGMEAEELPRIFDRFYQSEHGKDFGGTGIGLALSRELARLHGGDISVTSEPGKGSVFTVTLPATTAGVQPVDKPVDQDEFSADLPAIEHIEPESDDESRNELPVLLVTDDNKDIRNFIKSSLSSDFRVIEAENGELGYKTALETIPDIIISDVMMPVMDGYQFCEKIKKDKNTSHIPVIMLTAKASEESEMEGLSIGAEDYIRKPFNTDILRARCLNLINLREEMHRKLKNEMLLQPSEITVTSMDDEFLKEVHTLIEQNLADPDFNVENLCKKLYMSRTTVYRKIQALTGESPTQFIRAFRIKRGAQLIKAKAGTITEIAFMTGFSSSAYFTKCFKEIYHQLPSEYE